MNKAIKIALAGFAIFTMAGSALADTTADVSLFIEDGNLVSELQVSSCPYLQTFQDPEILMGNVTCHLGLLRSHPKRRTGLWIDEDINIFGHYLAYPSAPNASGMAPCGITYNLCQFLAPIGFPFYVQATARVAGISLHSDVYRVDSCESGLPQ